MRLDPRTDTFYAEGLTHAAAQTPARALRVLSDALASRHTRAHKLNSYSSRSHCLVTLTVSSQEVGSSPGQELMSGIKGGMRRCAGEGGLAAFLLACRSAVFRADVGQVSQTDSAMLFVTKSSVEGGNL